MHATATKRSAWIRRLSLRALLISVVTTLLSLFYSINQGSPLGPSLRVIDDTYRGYPFSFLLRVYWGPIGNYPAFEQYTFYPFYFVVDIIIWLAAAFVVLFMLRTATKK